MEKEPTKIWSGPVICFGELVWDLYPKKKRYLGGAPINVAVHLRRLGCAPVPVSAVGQDKLGDEAITCLAEWGLDTSAVAQLADRATGTVKVTLRKGQPSFKCAEDAAWNAIPAKSKLLAVAGRAVAVVHGSMALDHKVNRNVLGQLLERSPGMHVFDANLRKPKQDLDLVLAMASGADLVKVNRDELSVLLGGSAVEGDLEEPAMALGDRCNAARVCVTDGAAGAGLLDRGRWFWEDAHKVEVKDTVGAGDAFLAVLLAGMLSDADAQEALARACRAAEFVASKDGATPDIREVFEEE